jgi:hypothetical protein
MSGLENALFNLKVRQRNSALLCDMLTSLVHSEVAEPTVAQGRERRAAGEGKAGEGA